MGRTTRAVGWVSVRRAHQVSIKRFSATDSVVEVVDLEPERDAVPVRSRQRIADPAVVMLEVEVMQLQDEPSVANKGVRIRLRRARCRSRGAPGTNGRSAARQ
jgi:hypothetical protein